MSLQILNTSNAEIGYLALVSGETVTVRVKNTGASTLTVKMFATGYDAKVPDVCSNAEGKEVAEEGFVMARESGVGSFAAIDYPATVENSFDDQSAGLSLSISAGAYKDVEVKLVAPEDADTAGMVNFGLLFVGA